MVLVDREVGGVRALGRAAVGASGSRWEQVGSNH